MGILLTIFTSALTTLLVGRMYLNFQYHKSNAGYRQAKIIEATKVITAALAHDDTSLLILRRTYKQALAPVIERLARTFGTQQLPRQTGMLPFFQEKEEADGWQFYTTYLHPVMTDLNNNAFIGWLPFIPNVRRLTTLWEMCHQLENIITETERIQAWEKQMGQKGIFPKDTFDSCSIPPSTDPTLQTLISPLLAEYQRLETTWQQWLKLVAQA